MLTSVMLSGRRPWRSLPASPPSRSTLYRPAAAAEWVLPPKTVVIRARPALACLAANSSGPAVTSTSSSDSAAVPRRTPPVCRRGAPSRHASRNSSAHSRASTTSPAISSSKVLLRVNSPMANGRSSR